MTSLRKRTKRLCAPTAQNKTSAAIKPKIKATMDSPLGNVLNKTAPDRKRYRGWSQSPQSR
jgi:hypothetical protein